MEFDAEALAMMKRASPLPAPPEGSPMPISRLSSQSALRQESLGEVGMKSRNPESRRAWGLGAKRRWFSADLERYCFGRDDC